MANGVLGKFDEAVQQRRSLKSWWSLREKETYDGGGHKLRVDTQKPGMVALCGQAYAGARNYHDAPDFFVQAVAREIQSQACNLAAVAYEKELARLDALIESQRELVLKELASE